MKISRIFILSVLVLIITGTKVAHTEEELTETLELSTYYPAPYGSYRELRARRMAIGNSIMGTCTKGTGLSTKNRYLQKKEA